MSFFISDTLKGRISEKELLDSSSDTGLIEVENNLKFGLNFKNKKQDTALLSLIEKMTCQTDGLLEVYMNVNIDYLEKIFFKKLIATEIVIGNSKKDILKYELLDAKKSYDSFEIRLAIYV